ncbi:MAG: aminopeptidase P family protein [Candidatus Sungbacteria bacterium]|uniref:Aminopeptidase P family protein n=1 Tax=Candidatus Sungiibacteriota bacterium TaxID=2750080 RepID=A0A932VQW5_9BACT|nr:aminopeptidase P family protein [Candidatus Sungbacteria bacterium]
MKTAKILWGATDLGAPHFSSDILWRTGFRAPDAFFLIEIGGKTWLFLSPLEIGRAHKEARADHLVLTERFAKRGEVSAQGLARFLRGRGVRKVLVAHAFPHGIARLLREHFSLHDAGHTLYPERACKTTREIAEICSAQRACEEAMAAGIAFLRKCKIKGTRVYDQDRVVTSEMIRRVVGDALWRRGYLGSGTIVACGIQAADPHCMGWGPIAARRPIVMDVFPVSLESHYYADMTRTVFKGRPSPDDIRMYEAVAKAQEIAFGAVRAGADGATIHAAAKEYLASQKYPTDTKRSPAEGFIHGLGHGVGIDIHEAPHMGVGGAVLEEGNVVTIEPGLYYHRPRRGIPAGGIRLEDMVLVMKSGGRNLTKFPKGIAPAIIP